MNTQRSTRMGFIRMGWLLGLLASGACLALLGCSGDDGNSNAGSSTGGSATGGTATGAASGTGGAATGGDATGGTPGTGANSGVGGSTGGAATGGGAGTGGMTSTTVPGTENYDCSAAEGDVPGLRFVEVASGFDRPVFVTHPPGDTSRLFVVEQNGIIRIVEGTNVLGTPFLEIDDRTVSPDDPDPPGGFRGEQGLLGLAFHPGYATNGLFYVHYSAANSVEGADDGDTIISEFSVSDDPNVADDTSERIVLRVDQPASNAPTGTGSNHNGGSIGFGADGMLYIALGDGGGGNDSHGNGQDESTLLGTISRIDVNSRGAGEYGIPAGNLSETLNSAAPEVWDYGLRNPFRFGFDGCTGDLYIGDVGQDTREEVNVEGRGTGHFNYGWPITEGLGCRGGGDNCDKTGLTDPVADFATLDGSSVTGGNVYRGSAIPGARGVYFYADAGTGRMWRFRWEGGQATDLEEITGDMNSAGMPITSISNGGDGELYATVLFPGTLVRIEAD